MQLDESKDCFKMLNSQSVSTPRSEEMGGQDDSHKNRDIAPVEHSHNNAECFFEVLQKKYKCFILYIIILISICEFFYLFFKSGDVTQEDFASLISKFLNRTGNVKI